MSLKTCIKTDAAWLTLVVDGEAPTYQLGHAQRFTTPRIKAKSTSSLSIIVVLGSVLVLALLSPRSSLRRLSLL